MANLSNHMHHAHAVVPDIENRMRKILGLEWAQVISVGIKTLWDARNNKNNVDVEEETNADSQR